MISQRLRRWLGIYPRVLFLSARTSLAIRQARGRGLFVDAGSNLGQGFDFFRHFYRPRQFDYALFEPNPHCCTVLSEKIAHLKNARVSLHKQAVGATAEVRKFFGLQDSEGGKFSQGGSIIPNHNSKYYAASSSNAIDVQVICFADFIESHAASYSRIVVKLDVEGAEYDVLDDLIARNLLRAIDTLYVEFHSQYMVQPDAKAFQEREAAITRQISASSCRLAIWQ